MIYVFIFSGTNIFCKGSVDTTILGVDTMVQNKGRNVKKSPSQVDTSPEQVVCELSNSFVELSVSSVGCNKLGHMKGECPENKKEKYKKIHKFKKPKAMVPTWSDEDSSEKDEEKSSSSESEEICFMANSSDGKVSTYFEGYSIDDWQDAYAELVENYSEIRKENKHLKKKIENIFHNQSINKRICELENEVAELNEEKENLLNVIDELKLASQKANLDFKELSEKLE
ncbi:hypothetical protein Taro_018306, partial [Colocasia esculenta]|nr:hypothetical protein [Colocasia esculenta]